MQYKPSEVGFMKKRIVVLFGGQSPEYDVSRIAAYYVIKYLDREVFEPVPLWVTRDGKWSVSLPLSDMEKVLNGDTAGIPFSDDGFSVRFFEKADIVFPIVFGNFFGGDGTINATLDLFNIPYVGSGYIAAASCMDKSISKMHAEKSGVPVAKYALLGIKDRNKPGDLFTRCSDEMGLPFIIKPVCGGSSFGVSLVGSRDEFNHALDEAFQFDSRVLAEEYIRGKEYMIAAIGTGDVMVSGAGEIVHDGGILDYTGKYIKETTKTTIAESLAAEDSQTLKRYAETIYRALDCSCYARIDFFKDEKTGRILFNEINSMPVIAQMSIFTKLWNKQGLAYRELIQKIIDSGFEKYGVWKKNNIKIPEIQTLPQEVHQEAKG